MENLMNVYVIWRCDEDDFFVTLMQFDDTYTQRQAMQRWRMIDYAILAYDTEYPAEPNAIANGASYELLSVFESKDIRWIY